MLCVCLIVIAKVLQLEFNTVAYIRKLVLYIGRFRTCHITEETKTQYSMCIWLKSFNN